MVLILQGGRCGVRAGEAGRLRGGGERGGGRERCFLGLEGEKVEWTQLRRFKARLNRGPGNSTSEHGHRESGGTRDYLRGATEPPKFRGEGYSGKDNSTVCRVLLEATSRGQTPPHSCTGPPSG